MNLTIQRHVEIKPTARTMQLSGLFDIPPTERSESTWSVSLPIESLDWRIGLVIGPSGSGKTTLVREAFPDAPFISANIGYDWPADRAIVDGFPADLSVKDVTAALSSVGFSTPPAWLRPFRCLSTGEQFRATVARAIVDPAPLVVIDEFTSTVDRIVAQIGSAAVAKVVRRTPLKQVVCVTCHYDVEEWLCPDWVTEMPTGTFAWRSLRRPPIQLEITRVNRAAWDWFKHHHYLDTALNPMAKCFLATWRGRPVAFASVIHSLSQVSYWREHRTVCLPDFQGVGIGNALSAFVAGVMKATGKRYMSTTSNPAMIRYRSQSNNWRMIRKPSLVGKPSLAVSDPIEKKRRLMYSMARATNRLTVGFEFVGPARPDDARRLGILS